MSAISCCLSGHTDPCKQFKEIAARLWVVLRSIRTFEDARIALSLMGDCFELLSLM